MICKGLFEELIRPKEAHVCSAYLNSVTTPGCQPNFRLRGAVPTSEGSEAAEAPRDVSLPRMILEIVFAIDQIALGHDRQINSGTSAVCTTRARGVTSCRPAS